MQQDLTKMYKPLTEKVEPVLSTMKALPTTLTESMKAITFPSVQAIEGIPLASAAPLSSSLSLASSESGSAAPLTSSLALMELGKIATEYLTKYAEKNSSADGVYGFYYKDRKFYIGNTRVLFHNDDITLLNEHGEPIDTYTGTHGLWELIVSKEPNSKIYNPNDLVKYQEIVRRTNTLRRNNDPNQTYPKSSKSYKWTKLLKPIWEHGNYYKSGEGVETIILPSDPQALLQRLDLLLASKKAGNTGQRNELVAICDELKRQGIVTEEQYAELNKIINK